MRHHRFFTLASGDRIVRPPDVEMTSRRSSGSKVRRGDCAALRRVRGEVHGRRVLIYFGYPQALLRASWPTGCAPMRSRSFVAAGAGRTRP